MKSFFVCAIAVLFYLTPVYCLYLVKTESIQIGILQRNHTGRLHYLFNTTFPAGEKH